MRSFYLLSLVFSILLLSCSPSRAELRYRREQPRGRHRYTNKREVNAAFTYFNDGLGACGATNGPEDFIVALNSAQYDGGSHCFQMITITVNGKTAQAQITDECTGCSYGGLDFSRGLFNFFGATDGVLHGSWSYNNDIAKSSSTSTTPLPTQTTTIATSTSSTSLSPTTELSTVVPSQTSVSTVPTSTPEDPQMVAQVHFALLELGGLLEALFRLEV